MQLPVECLLIIAEFAPREMYRLNRHLYDLTARMMMRRRASILCKLLSYDLISVDTPLPPARDQFYHCVTRPGWRLPSERIKRFLLNANDKDPVRRQLFIDSLSVYWFKDPFFVDIMATIITVEMYEPACNPSMTITADFCDGRNVTKHYKFPSARGVEYPTWQMRQRLNCLVHQEWLQSHWVEKPVSYMIWSDVWLTKPTLQKYAIILYSFQNA